MVNCLHLDVKLWVLHVLRELSLRSSYHQLRHAKEIKHQVAEFAKGPRRIR